MNTIQNKPPVLLFGPAKPVIMGGLSPVFEIFRFTKGDDPAVLELADKARAVAVSAPGGSIKIDAALMSKLPKLEIVSSFGVGYDHIDVKWAAAHGVVVTNTPDVLTEEVADTALGLLLYTLTKLQSSAAGQDFTAATRPMLRGRVVGVVGLGRIGKAIATRLRAFDATVVYYGRKQQPDVLYRFYSDLTAMAQDVDVLILSLPGGQQTRALVNAKVLEALGKKGILINVARGSVVDEKALIKALKDRAILSAALDVFEDEPNVPRELVEMEHVVLAPHVASASVHTRQKMDQLVVDNLVAWAAGRSPLTPVPETPLSQSKS